MRVVRADRRVVGQIDNALVIVGDLQLGFRDQHAAALDIADLADAERGFLPGMKAPGGAKTPFIPARAFGAPQTTWIGSPVPVSTMQTRSRSAFGCCLASATRAMMNGAK